MFFREIDLDAGLRVCMFAFLLVFTNIVTIVLGTVCACVAMFADRCVRVCVCVRMCVHVCTFSCLHVCTLVGVYVSMSASKHSCACVSVIVVRVYLCARNACGQKLV